MNSIYLDNAATTMPCEPAVNAAFSCMVESWGNPSSLHSVGLDAEKKVTEARKAIAAALVCEPDCIYFTSGATESNNTVIFGCAEKMGKRKKKIVVTDVEHSSVAEPMNYLEKCGFEVVRIRPDKSGVVDADEFIGAVDENTFLASCMMVNNETGAVMPVKKIFTAIKRKYPDCMTHCDAVQGFLKFQFKAPQLEADFLTISAHKVHAVKGIGVLYVRKGVRIPSLIYGGGQEKGFRSGTESVPLISAFGASVRALMGTVSSAYDNVTELCEYLAEALKKKDYIVINSTFDEHSPYIVNFSVVGIRSEIMLHFLESKGIYVSSGSACSKGKASGVLSSMGISDRLADCAIRVSFSRTSTKSDVDMLMEAIEEGKNKLAKVR